MIRKKHQQKRSCATNTNSPAGDGPVTARYETALAASKNKFRATCGPTAFWTLSLGLALFNVTACAHRSRSASVMRDVQRGYTEKGVASWYGHPYHGRTTASGEIYDMNQLIAAHRRLPCDTVARIEHRGYGQWVEVRSNDRGPFVEGRILDLSRAATERIGLLQQGTAQVKAAPPAGAFTVQAGTFSSRQAAEDFCARHRGTSPFLRIVPPGAGFRVVTGRGDTRQ